MKYAVNIGGMSCAHCVKSVRESLECLPGARIISVEIGRAYLHASCKPDEVRGAVEEAGFDVLSIEEE